MPTVSIYVPSRRVLKTMGACMAYTAASAAAIAGVACAGAAFAAPDGAPDTALIMARVFGVGVSVLAAAWAGLVWAATAGTGTVVGMTVWYYAAMVARVACLCTAYKLAGQTQDHEQAHWGTALKRWSFGLMAFSIYWMMASGFLCMHHLAADPGTSGIVMVGAARGTFDYLLGEIAYVGAFVSMAVFLCEAGVRAMIEEDRLAKARVFAHD